MGAACITGGGIGHLKRKLVKRSRILPVSEVVVDRHFVERVEDQGSGIWPADARQHGIASNLSDDSRQEAAQTSSLGADPVASVPTTHWSSNDGEQGDNWSQLPTRTTSEAALVSPSDLLPQTDAQSESTPNNSNNIDCPDNNKDTSIWGRRGRRFLWSRGISVSPDRPPLTVNTTTLITR